MCKRVQDEAKTCACDGAVRTHYGSDTRVTVGVPNPARLYRTVTRGAYRTPYNSSTRSQPVGTVGTLGTYVPRLLSPTSSATQDAGERQSVCTRRVPSPRRPPPLPSPALATRESCRRVRGHGWRWPRRAGPPRAGRPQRTAAPRPPAPVGATAAATAAARPARLHAGPAAAPVRSRRRD